MRTRFQLAFSQLFLIFLMCISPLICFAAPPPLPTPCRNPMEGIPPGCTFIEDHHRCDSAAGTVPSSPVAVIVPAITWSTIVNKKLACCMNEFNAGDPYSKFDCVENAKTTYSDFNVLWSGAGNEDPSTMNALLLLNGGKKPISGFYTLNGGRCDEFSEFSFPISGIQPYKVDPRIIAGQQNSVGGSGVQAVGTPYPLPPAIPYNDILSKISKTYPSTQADFLRCPIMVRAAMVVSCPTNPVFPLVQKSYPVTATKTRCSVANQVQVHIRLEQLYEISGSPKMKTYDTILEQGLVNSISLERIIAQKNGTACPVDQGNPTALWNNVCKY